MENDALAGGENALERRLNDPDVGENHLIAGTRLPYGFLRERFTAFLASYLPADGSPAGLVAEEFADTFYLFILMMQVGESRSNRRLESTERGKLLQKLLARIFANPVKSTPLFFITRGLAFLQYIREQPFTKPALEIGCESGYTSSLIFREPFAVGVDINPAFEPLIRTHGMHRSYVLASADALPFPDASFATVVLNNTMYHLVDRPRVLREIYRVLQPGGKIFFDDITADIYAPENRPMVEFMRRIGGRETAQHFIQERSDVYGSGQYINPTALLTAGQYPEYLARFGFRETRARYFCSSKLTSIGYATHDVEYLFGRKDPEMMPWYRAWVGNDLAASILADEVLAEQTGGSFTFVTARK
jgi:SAM-dependent methyltransferase